MRAIRHSIWLVAALTGCASKQPAAAPGPVQPAGSNPAPTTAPPRASVFQRIPALVGPWKLTERAGVRAEPKDSLARFSDGSAATVTVFVYDPQPDVQVDADAQKWTAREGEKFKLIQEIKRSRGEIADFTVASSDSSRSHVPGVLEHTVATVIKLRNGTLMVDFQYLYLIDGKFLKVRATIPEQGWQQTTVPSFARGLARLVAESR